MGFIHCLCPDMVYIADPGYIATSSCLVEAAYTILRERDQLPGRWVLLFYGIQSNSFAFRTGSCPSICVLILSDLPKL